MAATKEAETENCYKIYICMSSTYESAKMEEMGKSQVKKGNEKRNEEHTQRVRPYFKVLAFWPGLT